MIMSALVVLIAASPAVAGDESEALMLPTDVPSAGANFSGAPPAFEVPQGGSATTRTTEDFVEFLLYRKDGTLFARAIVRDGRTLSGYFYDGRGRLAQAAHQYFQATRRSNQMLTNSRGSGTRLSTARKPRPRILTATCGSPSNYWDGWRLGFSTFKWYFNAGSTPSYMSVDTTETYLRNAHAQWYNNDNYCEIADTSDFSMSYGGRTTLSVGKNGYNTVGFGDVTAIGCSSDALACTLIWTDGSGYVEESDTRFDKNDAWINGQASGKYDTWSVMAHELGHTLGAGHVFDNLDNVMYYTLPDNFTAHHRLGRGDANLNNSIY